MARDSYEMEMMNSDRYFNNNRRKIARRNFRSQKTREKNRNYGVTAIFISRRTNSNLKMRPVDYLLLT